MPSYLKHLQEKVVELGGKLIELGDGKRVEHVAELADAADADTLVVNCTGMGAKFLGGV